MSEKGIKCYSIRRQRNIIHTVPVGFDLNLNLNVQYLTTLSIKISEIIKWSIYYLTLFISLSYVAINYTKSIYTFYARLAH